MQIPRHWAHAEREVADNKGDKIALKVWGWSLSDLGEARAMAQDKLVRLASRVAQSGFPEQSYLYASRPVREEIIEEFADADGTPLAVLTRNRYGCIVLNTARMLFLDIDIAPPTLGERVKGWFSKKSSAAADAMPGNLRAALEGRGAFRVYKTAAGFRVMGISRDYEPDGGDARQLMLATQTDSAFVQLCQVQKSFRARLTPKPWRCGHTRAPDAFPFENAGDTARHRDWLSAYERAANGYATCRFIEAIGNDHAPEHLTRLADLHDRMSRARENLPLA